VFLVIAPPGMDQSLLVPSQVRSIQFIFNYSMY